MKKLVALLLCFALLMPAFTGAFNEESPPEPGLVQDPTPDPVPEPTPAPASDPAPSAARPKLRLRYAVDEDNVLIVRGTFYLRTPDAPGGVPDGAEFGVAVLSGEPERSAWKTVTVSGGRFTARFEGLHGAYEAVGVFEGERPIGRIHGPIYVGAGAEPVPERTPEPTPEPTAEPTPEPTPEGAFNEEQPWLAAGFLAGDLQAMAGELAPMAGGEPMEGAAFIVLAAMSIGVQLTATQTNPTTITFSVTGEQGELVTVTLSQGAGPATQTTQIALPAGAPGTLTTATGAFTVSALGAYTVSAQYVVNPNALPPASVNVGLQPSIYLDPISDASPVVVGRTGANLQVEITAIIDGAYATVKTQSNFRGAFYAAMRKPLKAGSDVWITVFYPGGTVQRHVFVQRARDLPSYPNNLSLGQYGTGVFAMQQRLLELGYDVDVNALFDAKTLKAVLDFQRINSIAQDGIGGPVTRALMFSVTAREYTAGAVGSAGVLKYGDEGAEVKTLQTALRSLGYYGGRIDGRYGDGTRTAVRAFERRNGLPVDGIADLIMQALLYSGAARKAGSGSDSTPRPSSTPRPNVTATAEPTAAPDPFGNQPAATEMQITPGMAFGTTDIVAEKALAGGTLRIEAESAYSLLDMRVPGMLLRASYVDASGKAIPSRIRWIAPDGGFIVREDQRAAIALYTPAYTSYGGEIYWSLTPYFEAMSRGALASPPAIGMDNMIFWLDRPLMSAQPGREWRLFVQAMDLYDDQLWQESAEVVLTLGEGGVVTLNTDAMNAEDWKMSTLLPEG
ncbi:MAG: peptidoglycan-binding protein [Clostridia bacterium]|nr:peptidoglycan-binding protein [Clostridia bacterium]